MVPLTLPNPYSKCLFNPYWTKFSNLFANIFLIHLMFFFGDVMHSCSVIPVLLWFLLLFNVIYSFASLFPTYCFPQSLHSHRYFSQLEWQTILCWILKTLLPVLPLKVLLSTKILHQLYVLLLQLFILKFRESFFKEASVILALTKLSFRFLFLL